jgi:predicted CXXCH cytochrome family protein
VPAVPDGPGLAAPGRAQANAAAEYTKEGADTCLGCHDDESATYSASALFKTKHAQRGDQRSPFGRGRPAVRGLPRPGRAARQEQEGRAINTFKPDSKVSLQDRNQICMSCHEGSARTAWHAGAHERAQSGLHRLPQGAPRARPGAEEGHRAAGVLHLPQAAARRLPEDIGPPRAPGQDGLQRLPQRTRVHHAAMLSKPTVNQTCFSCHAEKRGPVLWEHAPVAEDCALCHNPHGSVRQALLVKTPPHAVPAVPQRGGPPVGGAHTGRPARRQAAAPASFLVGSGCVNCHTQVHGSNHPSGAKLMR